MYKKDWQMENIKTNVPSVICHGRNNEHHSEKQQCFKQHQWCCAESIFTILEYFWISGTPSEVAGKFLKILCDMVQLVLAPEKLC